MSGFFLLGGERVEVAINNPDERISKNTLFKVVGENGEMWNVHGDTLVESYEPVSTAATEIVDKIESRSNF